MLYLYSTILLAIQKNEQGFFALNQNNNTRIVSEELEKGHRCGLQ